MVVRGRVENGVVVFADGDRLPEGQDVTVFAVPAPAGAGLRAEFGSSGQRPDSSPISKDRQEALLRLIGMWKTAGGPENPDVKRILDEESKHD